MIVSSRFILLGDIFPTIKVEVLAVKESWRSLVSLDYLKAAIPLLPEDKLWITFPRVVRDWLIFLSSLKCS